MRDGVASVSNLLIFSEVDSERFISRSDGTREREGNRPRLHATALKGWLNDPNGLVRVGNEYHVFYQTNPNAPEPPSSCWGHMMSEDLVNWIDLPIALQPVEEYDQDGCYTGSSLVHGDAMYVVYTGHREIDDGYLETINVAVSRDGVHFERFSGNPVVRSVPPHTTMRFRDPCIWKKDNCFYMVVGAQDDEGFGKVCWYRSDDLTQWRYLGEWSCCEGELGTMWECPNYAAVDGKALLIMSPKGGDPQLRPDIFPIDEFGCCYTVGAIGGPFKEDDACSNNDSGERAVSFETQMHTVDYGFDFYAPQLLRTPGRTLMWGWFATPSSPIEQRNHRDSKTAWEHALTLPREIHVVDGVLRQWPAVEIESLRGQSVACRDIVEGAFVLPVTGTKAYDVMADFNSPHDKNIHLELARSVGSERAAKHNAMGSEPLFVLDVGGDDLRTASLSCYGRRRGFELQNEIRSMRLIVDGRYLELFINGGESVVSCRTAEYEKAFLSIDGSDNMRVDAYAMRGYRYIDGASPAD